MEVNSIFKKSDKIGLGGECRDGSCWYWEPKWFPNTGGCAVRDSRRRRMLGWRWLWSNHLVCRLDMLRAASVLCGYQDKPNRVLVTRYSLCQTALWNAQGNRSWWHENASFFCRYRKLSTRWGFINIIASGGNKVWLNQLIARDVGRWRHLNSCSERERDKPPGTQYF